MAPLPPDNTNRLILSYRVNGTDQHTVTLRFPVATTEETYIAKLHDVLEETAPLFYTDTVFESVRIAARGNPNSFPFGWTEISGEGSITGRPADFRARFFSLLGRSEDGRQWHTEWFGALLSVDADFIIKDADSPALASFRDALLSDPDPTVSISEEIIIPLNYSTSRVSAYWQRKIARGG